MERAASTASSTTVRRVAESGARRDRAAEAFAAVYRELLPPVYGYVRFRVGDPHLAEDLTEEVFARALARIASVRDADRVRPWIFGIARHVVADARRRAGSAAPTLSLESAEREQDDAPLVSRDVTESPEGEILRREERRRVVALVAGLDGRARDVIGLRFAAGLRHRDIGRALGLSEANVAQVLRRALATLRSSLQGDAVRVPPGAPGDPPVPTGPTSTASEAKRCKETQS